MMKKLISFLLSAVMVFALTACGNSTDSGDAAQVGSEMQLLESGKLILATEATFPPYEMPAPDGAGIADTGLDGIDIAIAVEIADRLGLQLEIHDIPFDDALYAPANGKADLVMAAMRVSPEREAFMLHSEPYAPADLVLITSDSVNPKREYDYREKQFGAVENTASWVNCMDQFGEKRTTVFQTNAEAVQAVLDGKIDAFMLDRAPAETIVEQVDGLVIIDKPFYKGDYAIWMAQDNTGLQKAVNDALAAMEDDGTLQAILERYIPNPGL